MIVYSSNNEVIVCESYGEEQLLIDYFDEGGRDLDDYDREEMGTFHIVSDFRIS